MHLWCTDVLESPIRIPVKRGGPWRWGDIASWERWHDDKYQYISSRYTARNGVLYAGVITVKGPYDHVVLHAPRDWDGTLPESDGSVVFYEVADEGVAADDLVAPPCVRKSNAPTDSPRT